MRKRPPKHFSGVPVDAETGEPLNVALDDETYVFYIDWLADYLYRPSPKMPASAVLSLDEAWTRISPFECEIASWIWEHPWEDYPPDNYQPRHADILHRVVLSRILSRVPDHPDRREVLHRFYVALVTDSGK